MTEIKATNVRCSAQDRYIDKNMILPTETKLSRACDIVSWGDGNAYPDYLLDLYKTSPTLRTIVNGNVDFICGDDIEFAGEWSNRKGVSVRKLVRSIAKDYEIYGGFALHVIRNKKGDVAEVYRIDPRHLRTNKDCNVFWYNEEFGKKFGAKSARVLPKFLKDVEGLKEQERAVHGESVLFVKDEETQVYPAPLYSASVKACELERCIDDFHLNAIENDFVSSFIINLNNGTPEEDIKTAIEKDINEKFCGHENGGRVLISFNEDQDHAITTESPKVEDFGARYDALAKHSRQQIFTAFRAIPALFGINPENNGFSNEEYDSAFRLYNRTQIQPVQQTIKEAFEMVYGQDVLSFVPFSIDTTTTSVSENNNNE